MFEMNDEYQYSRYCKMIANLADKKGQEVQKNLDNQSKEIEKTNKDYKTKQNNLNNEEKQKMLKEVQESVYELSNDRKLKNKVSCEILQNTKEMIKYKCKQDVNDVFCSIKFQ